MASNTNGRNNGRKLSAQETAAYFDSLQANKKTSVKVSGRTMKVEGHPTAPGIDGVLAHVEASPVVKVSRKVTVATDADGEEITAATSGQESGNVAAHRIRCAINPGILADAIARAEREEQEAIEKAERENAERAEREAIARAEREAIEKAEQEAREEAIAQAEREETERAARNRKGNRKN